MSIVLGSLSKNGPLIFSFQVEKDTDQKGKNVDCRPERPELSGKKWDFKELDDFQLWNHSSEDYDD